MSNLLITALEQSTLLEKIQIQAKVLYQQSPHLRFELDELVSIGWQACEEKYQDYDIEKGASVMTYLRNTARWAMMSYIREEYKYCQRQTLQSETYSDEMGDEASCAETSYHIMEFEDHMDFEIILDLLPDEDSREMVRLWATGVTLNDIADEFNISTSWCHEKIMGWVTHLQGKLKEDIFIVDVTGKNFDSVLQGDLQGDKPSEYTGDLHE